MNKILAHSLQHLLGAMSNPNTNTANSVAPGHDITIVIPQPGDPCLPAMQAVDFHKTATNLALRNVIATTDSWKSLTDRWSYDLFSRKPSPPVAITDVAGNQIELKPTSLDMAALLSALADRRAVVQIPHYTSRRAGKAKANQINLSPDFRRGRITSVVSNKDVFSFGLRIVDMSVLQASASGGDLGAPRNFMIMDVDGDWYEGWDQIDFVPDAAENAFIAEFQLALGGEITFDTFISPNRWTSFFGQDYLTSKLAVARAEDEAAHWKEERLRLSAFAPTPSYRGNVNLAGNPTEKSDDARETRSVSVTAFNAKVECQIEGSYRSLPDSIAAYEFAKAREHDLSYVILPKLRFATRATEYAFHQHVEQHGLSSFPSWISKSKSWTVGYREPGRRTDWNRMSNTDMNMPKGVTGLMWRTWAKTEKVTAR